MVTVTADFLVFMTRLIREVGAAVSRGDQHGPHGTEAELVQVGCTVYKMFREVRRAAAAEGV